MLLCIKANIFLPQSLEQRIECCAKMEESPVGKAVFDDLKANIEAAKDEIIRRYYTGLCERRDGKVDQNVIYKLELLLF